MLDREQMAQVAKTVVERVLALRAGETVSIIRDRGDTNPFGDILSEAVQQMGAEPVSLMIVPRTVGGQELPEPVAGALSRSNALISIARWVTVHTRAISGALAAGARSCNLRNYQDGMLESPGMTVDYEVVRQNALAMDSLLEQAREVRFTTVEGSDVTMQLCGRKGKAQTGFADQPGKFCGLPDGEATVAPLEGSTQGCIVSPYIIDKIDQVTEPFQVDIKDGWIVNVEGGKQAQHLKDIFETHDSNARRMASQFALGMNPGCRVIPDTREVSKKLGTLHVAMGDNISLGGTIQSDLHIDFVLLNPTVWLDGKLVLENGKLFI